MARPKRVFNDDEIKEIERYAHDGCYSQTIAAALDIPITTLKRRFGRKIQKWRALGKLELKHSQRELAKTNPQMAIFLGKNELGQTDKKVYANETPAKQLNDKEVEAVKDLARQYKLKLARATTCA